MKTHHPYPYYGANGFSYFAFEENGKFGLDVLDKGNVSKNVFEAKFDSRPLWFDESFRYFLVQENGLYGICDLYGNFKIPCDYDKFHTAMSDFDGKIDHSGADDYSIVSKGNLTGLVNKKEASVIIPLGDYYNIYWNSITEKNYFIAKANKDRKIGIFAKNGQVLLPCISDRLPTIFNKEKGIYKIFSNRNYGLSDSEGIILPCTFDFISDLFCEMAKVRTGNKAGYINDSGIITINLDFEDSEYGGYELGCGIFSENLAKVQKENKIGYINKNGEIIIPCVYNKGLNFSDGLAGVSKNVQITETKYLFLKKKITKELFGFIDKNGNVIIPFEYDKIEQFKDGKAKITKNGKIGHIDIKGNEFW